MLILHYILIYVGPSFSELLIPLILSPPYHVKTTNYWERRTSNGLSCSPLSLLDFISERECVKGSWFDQDESLYWNSVVSSVRARARARSTLAMRKRGSGKSLAWFVPAIILHLPIPTLPALSVAVTTFQWRMKSCSYQNCNNCPQIWNEHHLHKISNAQAKMHFTFTQQS